MDLQEVGRGYMDWIGLAQDTDRWRTLVSAVMNLRVVICSFLGNSLASELTADVSELTVGSIFIGMPMKMEPTVSSETSAIRTQTPGNYPKRNKLHLEHGESLKTRTFGFREMRGIS